MYVAVNIFAAFLCWSMARKRGRKPFRWFLLGLFFTVAAVIVLFFLKPRPGSPNYVVSRDRVLHDTSPPVFASPATTTGARNTPMQRGQVDLNALRVAVRQSPPQTTPGRFTPEEERERRDFLSLVVTTAPTVDFGPVSAQTRGELERVWCNLGHVLAESGFAGGLSDHGTFYETGESEVAVEFYPVTSDGTAETVCVQFALALKEFQTVTHELQNWVGMRYSDNFGDPVLDMDETGHHGVLVCAGVCEPSYVTIGNLDQLCSLIRDRASVVRQDLPLRFGGVWIA